ncbi:MAG TPA: lytic transglycosylase domain-containing protein [Pyrinomonadaceae bacterium]|nr:lytic transglycosylase domain-containing protein [Pyrinomonadaceae bacterium]
MTRKQISRRALLFIVVAAVVFASLVNASAQESHGSTHARKAMVKPTSKRVPSRRLIKIRARAGDTLSLLGDRFGVTPEDLAAMNPAAAAAPLRAGTEIIIPLPSPELLARSPEDKSAGGPDAAEAEGEWVNVQGVLFRKGSAARSVVREMGAAESESKAEVASGKMLGRVVEVSEAGHSTSAKAVWIFLVGGARVEADSVNETEDGVWYTRGPLTIFVERSRVERIEREPVVPSANDSSGAWVERGWTTGNAKLDALIRENGERYGVDPYLIFCVMEQESHFKPRVVSPKGARGLMQLMPGTAAHFGVRNAFDPAQNIMGGTKYLKQLLENFGGRVDLVLAGYNAGEGAVMKYGGRVPPYRETRNYVRLIGQRYGRSHSAAKGAAETALAPAGGLR